MYDDIAISISHVSKMFKIYKRPRERILDLLGLGILTRNKADEFWALKDIDLKIKKGSKIALIGRNGAGKSTLLKIIAGNLKPTTGEVQVAGKVSALMELGTGFHPEFTGRENIYASLSYSGIVGKEAKEKFDEIVDFSELEEFIDKPVKTYSAGMYARLAFAASTAIVPEILIIDEILGAGDAYFVNKSIERMKKLTEGGTTVLFVSHDITAVQKMCNEAIWIDRGRVVMEGHILDVSAEYLASIRKQEEKRLRARNIRLKQNDLKTLEESLQSQVIYCHLITEEGAPKDKHPISNIKLFSEDKLIEELKVGDIGDNVAENDLFLLIDKEKINWSSPVEKEARKYRCFEDVGGEYQHALFAFKIPSLDELKKYKVEITYQDVSKEKVKIEYFSGEEYICIGELEANQDFNWKSISVSFIDSDEVEGQTNNEEQEKVYSELLSERERNSRIYGSGEVIIRDVQFLNEKNEETHIFTNTRYKKVRIYYFAKEEIQAPVFVLAYYLLDGTCAMQILSNKDGFEIPSINGEGTVEIVFDPLLLGKGTYLISAAIFKEVNLLDNVEPAAYDLHDKMYEIKVEQPFGINVDIGLINHPVRWGIKHGRK
ncbi:ABC transporter ATP-binding protein [Aneurinibacillus sp. UBA3580]|jgi:lipopolysaccharide transport system ATP-binding protein|uniref:ABC transporter ATP-binding protein n=1 Tax=Aneurinibacillus sp. UBA3580 TaxID=1946041 RepID=UPI00257F0C24|nr:ABC transporter ATP-binding protein [Aneurinibacillus sp. UBA3580]